MGMLEQAALGSLLEGADWSASRKPLVKLLMTGPAPDKAKAEKLAGRFPGSVTVEKSRIGFSLVWSRSASSRQSIYEIGPNNVVWSVYQGKRDKPIGFVDDLMNEPVGVDDDKYPSFTAKLPRQDPWLMAKKISPDSPDLPKHLREGQRVAPALAFPDEDSDSKPGAFKVSSRVLKLLGKEANINTGDVLFKRVRGLVSEIPYADLPSYFGRKEMSDAQDFIAGKPRAAFNKWLELLARNNAKLGKYVREVPENASLVFYLFAVRVSGKDLADILFKRYFETDAEHPEAIKAQRKRQQRTESIEWSLSDIEDAASRIRSSARAGHTYAHDDSRSVAIGAPNLEAGLRQQAMAAMGEPMLMIEGRQSTALRESAPPDVISWIMGRDLSADISRNNEAGYIPSAVVLGNRERGRQKDEIDAIGRRHWQHNYVSEYDGDTQLWISHRMASRASGEYGQLMREFGKILLRAGYKVKTFGTKTNQALIDRMYVLYNQDRIKAAERGHGKYLDAMRKGGATRMAESRIRGEVAFGRLLMSLPRQVSPTMDSLLESVLACAPGEVLEATSGKVEVFLQIFASSLVSQDKTDTMREMKRGGRPNIYRLGLFLQAAERVRSDVAAVLGRDDAASIALLKASLSRHFTSNFPPLKRIIKQIDAYVSTGKMPKLEISKEIKAAIKAEKDAKKGAAALPVAAEDLLKSIAMDSVTESVRDRVKSVSVKRGWSGHKVGISDRDRSALGNDSEALALLDRGFEYASSAHDAAIRMFPGARVAM